MAWEENSRICLHMQLIAILSRTGVCVLKISVQFLLWQAAKPSGDNCPPEITIPPDKKNPRSPEGPRGNTPVGVDGFEPPTLCL